MPTDGVVLVTGAPAEHRDAGTSGTTGDLDYLLGRARLVETEVRALIEHRRRSDPAPDDPFRGLYLTDAAVDRILSAEADPPGRERAALEELERAADAAERMGRRPRLRTLATRLGLTSLDLDLLLIALLPDLDSRFEKLYGYLNDDVTRRRATIGLAFDLLRLPAIAATVRSRLQAGAPLRAAGLLEIDDADRPFLTRSLRVPDRVVAHLLGDDMPDPRLADLMIDRANLDSPQAAALARCLAAGQQLIYVRDAAAGTGTGLVSAALDRLDRPALGIDLMLLGTAPNATELITIIARESALTGAVVVGHPIEGLSTGRLDLLRQLASRPAQVVLVGAANWDPAWAPGPPLLVEAPELGTDLRNRIWQEALLSLPGDLVPIDPAWLDDIAGGQLILGPDQVRRALSVATALAGFDDRALDADLVRRGALAQNAAGLERLSRRLTPAVGWADIVLPATTLRQLQEVSTRARYRDTVLREWRMRPGGGRGRGVLALFAGDSGTGKTMAAEVIAGDLGLDLYTVNLATVVDKYVGETEKNLERIFSEAGGVNAVLLFDEADAVFGKRGEVRDAHDRYANIESAYLLQRMETFDGLAILSTNLRSNIDDAFIRRLDAIIDFPAPDEPARAALWQRCLAPPLPCDADLDLDFCARSFTLSGGNIRSAAITAAYQAAGQGRPVGMADLIGAIQQEYRKLGRLVLDREFAPYLPGR